MFTQWTRCPETEPPPPRLMFARGASHCRQTAQNPLWDGENRDFALNELPKSRCANDRLLKPRVETAPCLCEPEEACRSRQRQALPKSRHLDRVSSLLRAGGPRQMVPRQTSNTTLIGTREGGGGVEVGGMGDGGQRLRPCALISCVLVKRPVLITCTVYEACGWQQEKHH